ncbi:MAG: short-chain fatty acyl-CoA regulator family protein [Azospirillaceae bacterium]
MATPRSLIGRRIRDRRRELRLTQSALAEKAGISGSYLNLIETDKRLIGGALLKRVAGALGLEVGDLSGVEDSRLAHDLGEIARTLALDGLGTEQAVDFVARCPDWARAFLALHRSYRDAVSTSTALSDRLSQDPALMDLSHAVLSRVTAIRSFAEILEQHPDLAPAERARFTGIVAAQSDDLAASAREMIGLLGNPLDAAKPTSPGEEVDDFIIHHDNHFPALEAAGAMLRQQVDEEGVGLMSGFRRRLGLETEPSAGSADLPPESRRFQLAKRVFADLHGDLVEQVIDDPRLASREARERARAAMTAYGAGAMLLPYEPFLKAAEATRYDVDLLAERFGASYEQIAHRLVTLRRPGAEGLAFAFLRADPAGNLSKPFSAVPGLRMPRFGGSCPLWALHAAFGEADRPVVQLAVMPQGERYLFIARRVVKRRGGYGATPVTYSVMLGCSLGDAGRIVYGDAFLSRRQSLETPVGINCRACPREDCRQRAHPAVGPRRQGDDLPP